MTDAAADGDVIEESDGWRIGHIQGQQYDFFTLLTYLATDVKMRGSGITTRKPVTTNSGDQI